MSSRLFYESDQGDISDENGEEVMDLEEIIGPYNIRTLMGLSRYKLSPKPILKKVLTQFDIQMQELAEEVAAEENIKKFNVYSDK
ncbi:hypothetical protein G6F43_012600 [Rhizopus delemar]|nr:hypothetical protein G6F43_012600 [Rhizopus delemar]